MPIHTIVLEGSLASDQEKTYVHLPFMLPEEAVRLEVAFSYSARIGAEPWLSGGNTIDLGLFDERGIDFQKAGFRGNSGSERSTFFITETTATPGYLPGPLNSGQWQVMLGVYKLAPEGCIYRAEITITTQAGHHSAALLHRARHALPATPPAAPYAPWLRGDLHCHTWHSDGKLSPSQLVERARCNGLDFLAVTDHNTPAALPELEALTDPGLILIHGVEVTTFRGHFNVWGIPDWIDFRVERPEQMAAALRQASALGGLTSCGHPKTFGPEWDFREVTNFQCLEVWNGPWFVFNEQAQEYWLSLLASGRRIPAIAGSDFHNPEEEELSRDVGMPVNWVYVPGTPSATSILQAIHAGHTSLADRSDGPFLELRGGSGYTALMGDAVPTPAGGSLSIRLYVRGGQGCLLRLLDQEHVLFEEPIHSPEATLAREVPAAGSRFVRAELQTPDGPLRALTNPIYLT
jgi:PHP domain